MPFYFGTYFVQVDPLTGDVIGKAETPSNTTDSLENYWGLSWNPTDREVEGMMDFYNKL